MGFTKSTFLALPQTTQRLLIIEAEKKANAKSSGTPNEEFERVDTPLSVYLGDWYLRHSYYRRDLRPVTVEHFVGEVLQLVNVLEKEMDTKDRDVHDFCFFFVSDDNRLFPLSLPKTKLASIGVKGAIELLLKVEEDRGEELFGAGSGFQVLEQLNNFLLNTGYFTIGSKGRGERPSFKQKRTKGKGTRVTLEDDQSDDDNQSGEQLDDDKSGDQGDKRDGRFYQRSFVNHKTTRYLGFDFETVVHRSHSYAMPYACSLIVYNDKGKELRRYTKISPDEEAVRAHLCRALQQERPKSLDEGVYLIGYNNSRFDNFMLHQSVTEHRLRYNDPFVVKGAILGMSVEDIVVKDLYRFVMAPLKKGCKDFGCKLGKGELLHWKYQQAYYDGDESFAKYLTRKETKVERYVERDVASMMELWFRCKATYLELTGLHIEDYHTLASIGYAHYKKVVPKDLWEMRPKITKDLEDFVRQAVCGGRSQVFVTGHHKVDVALVDVKSQYPHEMSSNKYPLGDVKWTKRYQRGKIGLYEVVVGKQPKVKMVAYNDGNSTNWEYHKSFTRVVSNVSIELMEEYGVSYQVKRGCYWSKSAFVFKDHMEELYKTKRAQDEWKTKGDSRYNPSLRNIVKLLMNSLSGKMVERTHTTHVALVQTKAQLQRFLAQVKEDTIQEIHSSTRSLTYLKGDLKDENVKRNVPIVWGILIYEYSRAHMYRDLYSKVEGLIATETDSLLATKKGILAHQKRYPELYGDAMGQLDVEYLDQSIKSIAISKKCLALYNGVTGEVVKSTFKGVNQSNDKVITTKEYTKLVTEEAKYRWYWDETKGTKVDVETYKRLANGERVTILCSQLTRVLKPKSSTSPEPLAHIRQVFLLKHFPRGVSHDEIGSDEETDKETDEDCPVEAWREESMSPPDVDWGHNYSDEEPWVEPLEDDVDEAYRQALLMDYPTDEE